MLKMAPAVLMVIFLTACGGNVTGTRGAAETVSAESVETGEIAGETSSAESVETGEIAEETSSAESMGTSETAVETSSAESMGTSETAVETSSAESVETSEIAEETSSAESVETGEFTENAEEGTMLTLTINGTPVSVEWEENDAAEALRALAVDHGLTIQMSMYGGFEQVGDIGQSLPRADEQTTTQAGDIVLYAGDQLVIFYDSNSWAYTRLGRITDKTPEELGELLGNGDVTVTIAISEQ